MVTDRLTSDRVGGRRKGRAGPPTLAVPGTATSSRSAAAHYPPFLLLVRILLREAYTRDLRTEQR